MARSQSEIYDTLREALDMCSVEVLRDLANGDAKGNAAKLARIAQVAGIPKDRAESIRNFVINNAKVRLKKVQQ